MKNSTIKPRFGARTKPLPTRTCNSSLRLTLAEAEKTATLSAAAGKHMTVFIRDTMLAGAK